MILEGWSPTFRTRPAGVYWDGGIIDSQPAPAVPQCEGLGVVSAFHRSHRARWLDKALPWRRARGDGSITSCWLRPSAEYFRSFPTESCRTARISRSSWGDDEARERYWKTAIAESGRLGEEFLEFTRKGDPSAILPL
jgi:hypothetical protein